MSDEDKQERERQQTMFNKRCREGEYYVTIDYKTVQEMKKDENDSKEEAKRIVERRIQKLQQVAGEQQQGGGQAHCGATKSTIVAVATERARHSC